jgi:hypothetical protein
MEAKYTPGPWTIENRSNWKYGGYVKGPTATLVAGVGGMADSPEVNQANARLIAAAPELLECLEWFANPPYPGAVPGEALLQQARAACAKARGISEEDDMERARR